MVDEWISRLILECYLLLKCFLIKYKVHLDKIKESLEFGLPVHWRGYLTGPNMDKRILAAFLALLAIVSGKGYF